MNRRSALPRRWPSAACRRSALSPCGLGKWRCCPDARRQHEALDDADVELSDAVDVPLQAVAPLDGTDAGRRAREDQVASPEFEQCGQEGNLVWNVPDHLVEIA